MIGLRGTFGYVRVSKDTQTLSVAAQAEKIRAAATVRGTDLAEIIIDEDESGKNLRRPGVQRLMKMIRAREVEAVIICKLDRLTRSVGDLGELIALVDRYGVALVSLSESLDTKSATGRLMVTLIAAISAWERETISERVSTVLRYKRSLGERSGNVPYGFSAGLNERGVDGKTTKAARLVPNPAEAAIVARMKELRPQMSLAKVCKVLNGEGLRTRKGTPWEPMYVHSILKKESATPPVATASTTRVPDLPYESMGPVHFQTEQGACDVSEVERNAVGVPAHDPRRDRGDTCALRLDKDVGESA